MCGNNATVFWWHSVQRDSVKGDRAAVRLFKARYESKQRCFATAARTKQSDDLTTLGSQRHAIDCIAIAERFENV